MNKEFVLEKSKCVDMLVDEVKQSSMTVVLDYRGLTVPKFTEFRHGIRVAAEGGSAQVVKNNFLRRAFDNIGVEYPKSVFVGPSLVINIQNDFSGAVKSIVDFVKENDVVEIKGGFSDDVYLEVDKIQRIAELPSREVLLAKLIGQFKQPITRLVGSLSGPLQKLPRVLMAIQEKKKETGGES